MNNLIKPKSIIIKKRDDEKYYTYESLILTINIEVTSFDYVFQVGIIYTTDDWKTIKYISAHHKYRYKESSNINTWAVDINVYEDSVNPGFKYWPRCIISYALFFKTNKDGIENIYWNNNYGNNFIILVKDYDCLKFPTIIDNVIYHKININNNGSCHFKPIQKKRINM